MHARDEVRDAVARFIQARVDPDRSRRQAALNDIGRLLESVARAGMPDEALAASLDGLSVRNAVVLEETSLKITGAFYTLGSDHGRTKELMLPVDAQLSLEPGVVSTVRVANASSLFEPPQSERQFQRAFESAVWTYDCELRLT